MLESITKIMTDESDGNTYRFIFHCDACGHPWHSDTYHSIPDPANADAVAGQRESDHKAAYERSNLLARLHFNRCPVCKKIVCNECFRIMPKSDMCIECAEKFEESAQNQQDDTAGNMASGQPETQGAERKATGSSWLRRLFGRRNTGPPQKGSKND